MAAELIQSVTLNSVTPGDVYLGILQTEGDEHSQTCSCVGNGINVVFNSPVTSPCLQRSWKVMWCSLGLVEMLHLSTFLSSTFTYLNTGRTD